MIEVEMTCKSFYVGDPKYYMTDKFYDEYGCVDNLPDDYSDGGVGTTEDGVVVSVVTSVPHGLGCFNGYYLESGQIGILNGDFCKTGHECSSVSVPSGKVKVRLENYDGEVDILVTDSETDKVLHSEHFNGWYTESDLY